MSIHTDTEYETERIEDVQAIDTGWNLTFAAGFSLYCTNEQCKEPPRRGEDATIYGRGFGYPVRGIRIGERVYRYQSEEEHKAEQDRYFAERDKERAVETAEMIVREAARRDAGEKYSWRDGMGEISGFGGGYEEMCRTMFRAGMRWLDEHPSAAPQFRGYKGVFGVISEDNADAKALSEAVLAVCPDCTGAMHQATVSACLYVKANGWDAYCEAMTKP